MNEFFDDLARRLADAAKGRGTTIDPPPGPSAELAEEILELAPVVAHSTERRFAPLASFVAGTAVDRLRRVNPALTDAELAAYVRSVRDGLEEPDFNG